MSLKSWWRKHSGKQKILAFLAALEILQIGLCFTTPQLTGRIGMKVPVGYDTPTWNITLTVWQAGACVATVVLIVTLGVAGMPTISGRRKRKNYD